MSYGREVTRKTVGSHSAAGIVLTKVVWEFRQQLGVHVDERQWNAEQLEKLDRLLYQHRSVFAEDKQESGCARRVEHEIHLTSDVPIRLPYGHIPPKCYFPQHEPE